ncbi:glycoside hydrolase family 97 C-terminal domain-containing protein [Streptomyces sp. NPDC049687]|uniref:glycoside hydrolase family 97 C-terminal domain-containing protein n=1 Tax=Streptomyces sp. NPDC049687 TaxID=3365596 RepID=UPI0037B13193
MAKSSHESTTLTGSIGECIAVARRSGAIWFLGAMTNETARTLSVPLDFLDSGVSYTATVYADGTAGRPLVPASHQEAEVVEWPRAARSRRSARARLSSFAADTGGQRSCGD